MTLRAALGTVLFVAGWGTAAAATPAGGLSVTGVHGAGLWVAGAQPAPVLRREWIADATGFGLAPRWADGRWIIAGGDAILVDRRTALPAARVDNLFGQAGTAATK